ncbi:MAG: hypothetical protein AAFS11_11080, partial [Planctomycetota bacterium]
PEPRIGIADILLDADESTARVVLTAWDLRGMLPARITPVHPMSSLRVSDRSVTSAESLSQLADPITPVHPSRTSSAERLGGRVAIFPRRDRYDISGSVVLNVNTAPADLLRVAMRRAQRGAIETVLSSRSRGVPSPAPRATRESSRLIQLIGRSNVWAVRADITVGPLTQSWWTVYESRGRGWSIIDRHEIAG